MACDKTDRIIWLEYFTGDRRSLWLHTSMLRTGTKRLSMRPTLLGVGKSGRILAGGGCLNVAVGVDDRKRPEA